MYGGKTSRGATTAMFLDSWPEASLSLVLLLLLKVRSEGPSEVMMGNN
jgi:hypothetical protein